jgi:hypothetical protein
MNDLDEPQVHVVKSLECPVISVNINSRFLMLFTAKRLSHLSTSRRTAPHLHVTSRPAAHPHRPSALHEFLENTQFS